MDDFDKSRFMDDLLLRNSLSLLDCQRWLFAPGMLFRDTEIWWPGGGQRPNPHEGIDFRQYLDGNGKIHSLSATTVVPAMFDGTVVDIFDDFLGKSILLAHDLREDDLFLHSIYGHVSPADDLAIGGTVSAGDAIATLTPATDTAVPPHLHLSVLLLPRHAAPGEVRWQSIHALPGAALRNPLEYIQ